MLQHIVLQGDVDLREAAFTVADALRGLVAEGISRFSTLGIRTPRRGQEVRAFWSIPGHECAVRLVRDLELAVVMASVESCADPPFTRVAAALAAALPSVPVAVILENESRFEAMPELVFLLALATRHAPDERVRAIVANLLMSSVEDVRVSAAGGAILLGGQELREALRAAAARGDSSPSAQRVLEASLRDIEKAATTERMSPFGDPSEAHRVRW